MIFLFNKHSSEANFLKSKNVKILNPLLELHSLRLRSYHLDRKIKVDLYLPTETDVYRSTLLISGFQQMEQPELIKTLTVLLSKVDIPNIGVVVIHDNEKKIEAEIEGIPINKNRGKKAERIANFITYELTPYLQNNYGLMREEHQNVFAGFSGGALSALSISWENPNLFRKVGLFSGVLSNENPASGEIKAGSFHTIPQSIGEVEKKPGLKFWFQTQSKDQRTLSNKNPDVLPGNDTLDLIKELQALGYTNDEITHTETERGKDNAWSKVFPNFLKWAFPLKTSVKMPQY